LKIFVIGTPDQYAETLRKIFARGLDYIVVSFPDSHDLETIKPFRKAFFRNTIKAY